MIESVAYEAALARVRELEAALAAERERAEKAERSLDARNTDYRSLAEKHAAEMLRADRAEADVAVLRPEVWAFAQAMERELRANDHKGGWKACTLSYLLRRLRDEVDELSAAAHLGDGSDVLSEAADIANFALMITDVCGKLPPATDHPGAPLLAALDQARAALIHAIRPLVSAWRLRANHGRCTKAELALIEAYDKQKEDHA